MFFRKDVTKNVRAGNFIRLTMAKTVCKPNLKNIFFMLLNLKLTLEFYLNCITGQIETEN
jgi:hypothetical protein